MLALREFFCVDKNVIFLTWVGKIDISLEIRNQIKNGVQI
jgi:hypothetical protein